MPFRLSLENAPIAIIEVSGELSDEELLAMTEEVTQSLREQRANGTKSAVVLDFSNAGAIAPSQRRQIGRWRASVRELMRDVCVGMAVVVKSPVIRGIFTAIAWFSSEPVTVVYVDTAAQGIFWAIDTCEAAGLTVPPTVKRRLKSNTGVRLKVASLLKTSAHPSRSRRQG